MTGPRSTADDTTLSKYSENSEENEDSGEE